MPAGKIKKIDSATSDYGVNDNPINLVEDCKDDGIISRIPKDNLSENMYNYKFIQHLL